MYILTTYYKQNLYYVSHLLLQLFILARQSHHSSALSYLIYSRRTCCSVVFLCMIIHREIQCWCKLFGGREKRSLSYFFFFFCLLTHRPHYGLFQFTFEWNHMNDDDRNESLSLLCCFLHSLLLTVLSLSPYARLAHISLRRSPVLFRGFV